MAARRLVIRPFPLSTLTTREGAEGPRAGPEARRAAVVPSRARRVVVARRRSRGRACRRCRVDPYRASPGSRRRRRDAAVHDGCGCDCLGCDVSCGRDCGSCCGRVAGAWSRLRLRLLSRRSRDDRSPPVVCGSISPRRATRPQRTRRPPRGRTARASGAGRRRPRVSWSPSIFSTVAPSAMA